MNSRNLKSNHLFRIGGMQTIYQVDSTGRIANKVLDQSGGHARKTIDLETEPEFEATVLDAEETDSLNGNPAFTGIIPE